MMTFFTDPKPFTHFGTLYGLPIYLSDPDGNTEVAGTNVIWDWMLRWYPPVMMYVQSIVYPQCQGFPICIKGRL